MRARKDFIRLVTAWIEESVVGYLIAEFDRSFECVREVGITPERRGMGIGRGLVHHCAETAVRETMCCDPLPHRRELFVAWGFTREDESRLWGARPVVAAATMRQA